MSIIRQRFPYQYSGVAFKLIGINVAVFAAMFLLRGRLPPLFLTFQGYTIPFPIDRLTGILSMIPIMVVQGWVWTFITYMFVHGGFAHILFNMFALFMFGVPVERQMGSREFLLFYLVTGALAGIFSFVIYYLTGSIVIMLMGASGAVYAVTLAYAVFYPDAVIYIWGILPLRAPILVLGFTVLSLFSIITGGGGNVAHLTHLAGFGFAWLYFLVRFGINPWRRLRMR